MQTVARRRIVGTAAAILAVFAGGTVAFHHVLHEPWHAAFYRTVITTTLTGLDTAPRGLGAELVTIALALSGVAIFGYLVAQLLEGIAREIAADTRREKRRRKMIGELRNHFIICGYGRVGRRAAEQFAMAGQPFVVLDFSEDAKAVAREADVLFVDGNGSEDDDLERAGIARAAGLLASADSDAQNVYITLSARARRPDLTIVARASDAEAERKLRHAGATRVVQPYSSAGTEMAQLALKPEVAAFLEIATSHGGPELRFEELEVLGDCAVAGSTIRELRIRRDTGALVIALRKRDGTFEITPNPDEPIEAGDVVIAMGTPTELQALEVLLGPRERIAG